MGEGGARSGFLVIAMASVCSALIKSSKPVHELWPPVVINDPAWLWRDHKSFVIQEAFFLVAATVIWWLHRGNCAPQNRVLFWTCVIGGNMIEIYTGLEGEIGCFWESQAMVMVLGRRFPLYCCWGMYVFMGYVPAALAFACDLGALGEAGLSGLAGGFLYQTFGILGCRHLWWVFHDDERLFDDRRHGDPAAHEFWMTATAWAIPLAVRWCAPKDATYVLDHRAVLWRAAVAAALGYIVLINVPFLVFFYPAYSGGFATGYDALGAFRVFLALCVVRGCRRAPTRVAGLASSADSAGAVALSGFCADRHSNATLAVAWLLLVLGLSSVDPAAIRRTGWGQFALCGSGTETSFWGLFERRAGLCPSELDVAASNFRLCDGGAPPQGQEWYTVCGVPMDAGAHAWLALHAVLAAASVLFALHRGSTAGLRAANAAAKSA